MKKLFSFLLMVALLLSLCACRPAGNTEKTLAFVQRYGSGAYESQLAAGFTEAAHALGFTTTVLTPADATAASQKTLIQDLTQLGVAGIALYANEVTGLEAVLKEAKEAGIPVITVGADTAGSQLLVQPSSPELVGKSLMDAMYDLTGDEGSFAVISGTTSFSGSDPWVSGMELASRDEKYRKVHWVETNYAGNLDGSVAEMKTLITELIGKYPDLEAICCVGGGNNLALCSQALEEMGSKIRATGMAQPTQMQDLMGDDRACPYYFLWSPNQMGKCAAYALVALVGDAILKEDGSLVTKLGEYALCPCYYAEFCIYAGPPFCFREETSDIYTVY